MRTAEELFNESIRSNEKRIKNMRNGMINDLERIAREISEAVEHLKTSDDYRVDTLVGNMQPRLLDVLNVSNRIAVLITENSAYEFAMKEFTVKEE